MGKVGRFLSVQEYFNHADSLYRLGMLDEAIKAFQKVIEINPSFTRAYNELGVALREAGRYEEAIKILEEAIKIDPNIPQLHNNLGNVLGDTGRLREERLCYQTALSLKPEYAEAWANLGTSNKLRGEIEQAIKNYQKAIGLNPAIAEFYLNLGIVLQEKKLPEEAMANFTKAVELNPNSSKPLNSLFLIKRQLCDWSDLRQMEKRLDELGGEDPFTSILRKEDPAENFKVAKSWSGGVEQRVRGEPYVFNKLKYKSKKYIHIGYISCDLRDHPIGQMVAPLFGLHDKKRFNVSVYSYGEDDDSIYCQMVQKGADRFIDIKDKADKEAAEMIYHDGVDILVDLTGYTLGNRLEICARRPAPVQVAWLGYPGTSGASFFDYVIVDKTVVLPKEVSFYSEKLIFLPHCYQINNNRIAIAKKNKTRKDYRLPDTGFIFASFSQAYKIEPVIWEVWMRILEQVPESVLWLWEQDTQASVNLRKEAGTRRVDPSRLIFSKKLPKEEHLARISLADLGLDTQIYGGHTTTSDFLWAGVPVVTLLGKHFASRVCASLLYEAGVPEMVTGNLKEYEESAVGLAGNPAGLKRIKAKLTQDKLKNSLYNTQRFVQSLEEVYLDIWKRYDD